MSLPARTKEQLAVGGNNNKGEKFTPDAPFISSLTGFDGRGEKPYRKIIDIYIFQSGKKRMVFAIYETHQTEGRFFPFSMNWSI